MSKNVCQKPRCTFRDVGAIINSRLCDEGRVCMLKL